MKWFRIRKTARQSIKEAFDNLPAGICCFDSNGILILCNRQMESLSHLITGHDLQYQEEIEGWGKQRGLLKIEEKNAEILVLPDGSAWRLEKHPFSSDSSKSYTEFIASDVTELYTRRQQLEEGVHEQKKILASMENISHNLAAITRSEESLRMKMNIHNDLGTALNLARQYLQEGCPPEKKAEFVRMQKSMSQVLLAESQNIEKEDPLQDLYDVAESLGMKIVLQGSFELPADVRRLLSFALRECLANTIRHARGDTVYAVLQTENRRIRCVLTNNGNVPEKEIAEGGGLSSLREKIQRSGGTMHIESFPCFKMEIILPDAGGKGGLMV